MTYNRTVKAALAETKSKFKLAEALATDIPAKSAGRNRAGTGPIVAELNEARDAIIAAGGEPRAVETMDRYRKTAIWVQDESGTFRWVPGLSFTAHVEACSAGLKFASFAKNPTKARDTRAANGAKSKDGPLGTRLEQASPEEVVEALSHAKPETVAKLVKSPEVQAVMRQHAAAERAQAEADWREERARKAAAPKPSTADRKAIQAATRAQFAPLLDALSNLGVTERVAAAAEALDEAAQSLADSHPSEEQLEQIDAELLQVTQAMDRLVLARREVEFKVSQ